VSRVGEFVKKYALSVLLRPAPAPKAGAEKTPMQHAFSLRGLVESGLPSVVFVVAFRFTGTRAAAVISLAVALLMVGERLLRKQRVNEAISGVFGVALAAALAGGTGEAKNYFLPEVVAGLAFSAVLLASVGMGKPLLGTLLGAVVPPFKDWRERPLLRKAFTHVTAVAGVWAAIKALILLSLYLADNVDLLAGAKLALGYPMLGVLVAYYWRVVKKALVKEALAATPETVPA
jgi:hypothetical protein